MPLSLGSKPTQLPKLGELCYPVDKVNGGCILSAWWKNAVPESSTPEKEDMCLVVCVSHYDIHLVLSVPVDEFFLGIVGISCG